MIYNYIKITFRNIYRNKVLSIINISGLAIGIACCLVILVWIRDETSYDSFYEKTKQLCSVSIGRTQPDGSQRFSTTTPGPLGPMLEEVFPEVEKSARYGTHLFSFGVDDKQFTRVIAFVDYTFTEMFTPDFIYGNPDEPFTNITDMVITRSMSELFFGDENPIGKPILVNQGFYANVSAVIEDVPENSHFSHDCLFSFQFYRLAWQRDLDSWGGNNYRTYVQLQESTSAKDIETRASDYINENFTEFENSIAFQPVSRMHLHKLEGGGLINMVYMFAVMAIFIILIAGINYMNLSTARSVKRSKEVGIRQVAGAKKSQLISQFLGESVLLTFIAANFAFIIAQRLIPLLNRISGKNLTLDFNLENILIIVALIIVTGILSGSYPAFAMTSAKTSEILKSNPLIKHSGSGIVRGSKLRKILVIFQFCISVFLIIGSIAIYKQINFIRETDLGYNKNNIVWVSLTGSLSGQYNTIKTSLLENPDVLSISRANTTPAKPESSTSGESVNWEGKISENIVAKFNVMGTGPDFLETFEMQMIEGRYFNEKLESDRNAFVLNETAIKEMGLEDPVGKRISMWDRDGTIIGVIKDFNFKSLHEKISPLIILNSWSLDNFFIKISDNNIAETITKTEKKIAEIIPGFNLDYKFVEDQIEDLYSSELNSQKIILYFTIIAIFISCLGLYGLSSFITEQRTKEIGIRKVAGASTSRILSLVTQEFIALVIIANLIAWPIAWMVIRKLSQNFAYSANIGIANYLFAALITIVIAMLTVSYQANKAANTNPAESFRYE